MIRRPRMTLLGVVHDAPDARTLADFYRRLLGWTVIEDEPRWVTLGPTQEPHEHHFSDFVHKPDHRPLTAHEALQEKQGDS